MKVKVKVKEVDDHCDVTNGHSVGHKKAYNYFEIKQK
jgi:hypothetical protein